MKNHRSIDGKGGQQVPFAVRNWQDLPDEANVDVKVVALMTGRSIPSVWRDVARGRLAPPRRLTPRCSRWQVGVIRLHLRDA
jgi:hypothetical protein